MFSQASVCPRGGGRVSLVSCPFRDGIGEGIWGGRIPEGSVSGLGRVALPHPYISFFTLLECFLVIYIFRIYAYIFSLFEDKNNLSKISQVGLQNK